VNPSRSLFHDSRGQEALRSRAKCVAICPDIPHVWPIESPTLREKRQRRWTPQVARAPVPSPFREPIRWWRTFSRQNRLGLHARTAPAPRRKARSCTIAASLGGSGSSMSGHHVNTQMYVMPLNTLGRIDHENKLQNSAVVEKETYTYMGIASQADAPDRIPSHLCFWIFMLPGVHSRPCLSGRRCAKHPAYSREAARCRTADAGRRKGMRWRSHGPGAPCRRVRGSRLCTNR